MVAIGLSLYGLDGFDTKLKKYWFPTQNSCVYNFGVKGRRLGFYPGHMSNLSVNLSFLIEVLHFNLLISARACPNNDIGKNL